MLKKQHSTCLISIISYCIIIVITTVACDSSSKHQSGFEDWHYQFLRDSSFQISHIIFPLQGLPSLDAEEQAEDLSNYYWTKHNWAILGPLLDKNNRYSQSIRALSDDIVIEYVEDFQSGLIQERRYSAMHGDWYLIFFSDWNKTAQNFEHNHDSHGHHKHHH